MDRVKLIQSIKSSSWIQAARPSQTYWLFRACWWLEVLPGGTPYPSHTHPHTHHLWVSHTDSVRYLLVMTVHLHKHHESTPDHIIMIIICEYLDSDSRVFIFHWLNWSMYIGCVCQSNWANILGLIQHSLHLILSLSCHSSWLAVGLTTVYLARACEKLGICGGGAYTQQT